MGPGDLGEREARWGHRGGVLELSGPVELIDAIERSLFSVGAVSSRIEAEDEAFLFHPGLLEIVTGCKSQSGLLALVMHANESGTLPARAEDRQ